MKLKTDVVIDLETLSLNTSDVDCIIQVSAVAFNRFEPTFNPVTFNAFIDVQEEWGELNTVMWWRNTNLEYLDFMLNNPHATSLEIVLKRFSKFITETCGNRLLGVWGNGSIFDNAFMINAYKETGIVLPWSYKHDACLRTVLKQVTPILQTDLGNAAECMTEQLGKNFEHWHLHNAEYDAMLEAIKLHETLRLIRDKGVE